MGVKMADNLIRTFIGIELPEHIHDSIQRIQDGLKPLMPDVRWTKYGNVHLTLKFLGEVSVRKLDRVIEETRGVALKFQIFNLRLQGLGAFPNIRKPSVVWIGISKGSDMVHKIVEELEGSMEKLGFPREKRAFYPHLTIGRVRDLRNPNVMEKAFRETEVDVVGEFSVERLSVIKSQLDPSGSIYTTMGEARLANLS